MMSKYVFHLCRFVGKPAQMFSLSEVLVNWKMPEGQFAECLQSHIYNI